jgi:hypothetical protein
MNLDWIQDIALQATQDEQELQKQAIDVEDSVLRLVQTEDGGRLMKMLGESYLYRQSHVRGEPDESSFREGQRSVVIGLIKTLQSALLRHAGEAAAKLGSPITQTHAETE